MSPPVADDTALLSCERLEVGHAGRALLPPINLSIGRQEFVAVIGRNGAGKSTWMRTLLGLLPPVAGRVRRSAGLRLSYLPQRQSFDDLYPLRSRDVVEMGLCNATSFLRRPSAGERERVERALRQMDVVDLAERGFRELSEGQKQRVLFARLAASGAALALLDEPTSSMDMVAEREAYGYLENLVSAGTTVVVVSHFLGLAREFADRLILLDRDAGQVVAGTPLEVFASDAFRRSYAAVQEADGA